MPRTEDLNQYRDIAPVVDKLLDAKGGFTQWPTRSAAINWRHRVYKYRKLADRDDLIGMELRNPVQQADGSWLMEVAFRYKMPDIITYEGKRLAGGELEPPRPAITDEEKAALEKANELIGKLNL